LGPFMQITTLSVQNSAERKDLGTATSAVIFFRSFGSSLGASVFGAILINRLSHNLKQLLPPQARADHISAKNLQSSTSQIKHAAPAIQHAVLESFAKSFHFIYLCGIPLAVLMFIAALLLKEVPLRNSTQEVAKAESLGS
jgi:hypothetical protein